MVDATRALLDELMGADRNLGVEERLKPRPKRSFTDRDVCKAYLCGFCPEEEFARTKYELGQCQYTHDEKCKEQWDALDEAEKAKYPFEQELKRRLDGIIADVMKKIERNKERLAAQDTPLITPADQQNLDMLAGRIAELLAQSETLGESGDIDGAQAAIAQVETLKAQRAALEREALKATAKSAGAAQMVCPWSGVIINVDEARQRDHKSGRNYHAWVKAHAVYKSLKELMDKRAADRGSVPFNSAPFSSGDRQRSFDRSGSKDGAGRGGEREHRDGPGGSRDRDRDRGKDRDRDRDKDRRDRYAASEGRRRDDDRNGSSRPRGRSRDRSPVGGGRHQDHRHQDRRRERERDR